jgi:hypothetical protein
MVRRSRFKPEPEPDVIDLPADVPEPEPEPAPVRKKAHVAPAVPWVPALGAGFKKE